MEAIKPGFDILFPRPYFNDTYDDLVLYIERRIEEKLTDDEKTLIKRVFYDLYNRENEDRYLKALLINTTYPEIPRFIFSYKELCNRK